ncbi:Leucine-rich repeat [Sesbania bispinosa]|nr:Leucine-rich repeat [Sesbania bispinosa]
MGFLFSLALPVQFLFLYSLFCFQLLTVLLPFNQSNVMKHLGMQPQIAAHGLALNVMSTQIFWRNPPQVSQLSKLLSLDLSNNAESSPTGTINLLQLKISNLRNIVQNSTKLEMLVLCYVTISSPVPDVLTNLTSLQALYLYNCELYGEFPVGIFHLPKLRYLDLGSNPYLTGRLPVFSPIHSACYNLMAQVSMGDLPASFANLTKLSYLLVGFNEFTVESMSWIELDMFLKLKKLTFLDLSLNKLSVLSGKSPSNVTGSRIRVLELASCNLVEFPALIRDLNDLGCLILSNNSISTLPSWLWRKASLQSLTVSHNSLRGEISPFICNLKSLMHLDLSFNNLRGNIPSCLGNFSQSLEILMLKGNKLSGLIPQTYMTRNSLQMIDFSNNNLQGQLPRALVNCGRLEYLDVSHNNINDSFPFWLGALPELKVLALRNNEFYGAIRCPMTWTCTFPKLHIIDLSHNEFSGNLGSEMIQGWKSMKASNTRTVMVYERLQEFYNMIAIDISSNRISGEIPEVMGDLNGLVLLNLSNNMLTGSIPSSLGKLSNLEALDLSLNSLSGNIPQQLTQITFLEFFNVSFNNLSGPIPYNKQFATFEGNSFEGNKGLCGNQLLNKCVDDARPSFVPPSASDGDQDTGSFLEFDWKIVLIGYGGGIVAGVALGSTFSPQILGCLRKKGLLS